ncbi:RecB family exonuclease [Patescibacteria group bacterium]
MDKIDFAKIYSVSKLSLFEQCAKAYHFSYVDEVYIKMKSQLRRDPANLWSFNTLGKAVHDSITLYFYLPKKEQTLKNLKDQLKLAWRSEAMFNKLPPLGKWGGFKTLDEERQYYKKALTMLVNFYNNFKFSKTVEFIPTKDILRSIEDYKKLIKPLNKKYDVSGKFDLILSQTSNLEKVKEALAIIDFKTSKNEDANDFQLRFYKLLAELNFKKPVTKASFYYLASGNIKEYDLDKLDSKEIKKEVLEKIDDILKEKEFAPKPSKLCKFCMFKSFCPAKKEIFKLVDRPMQEEFIEDLPF